MHTCLLHEPKAIFVSVAFITKRQARFAKKMFFMLCAAVTFLKMSSLNQSGGDKSNEIVFSSSQFSSRVMSDE
jgi:hypothetical protein